MLLGNVLLKRRRQRDSLAEGRRIKGPLMFFQMLSKVDHSADLRSQFVSRTNLHVNKLFSVNADVDFHIVLGTCTFTSAI